MGRVGVDGIENGTGMRFGNGCERSWTRRNQFVDGCLGHNIDICFESRNLIQSCVTNLNFLLWKISTFWYADWQLLAP